MNDDILRALQRDHPFKKADAGDLEDEESPIIGTEEPLEQFPPLTHPGQRNGPPIVERQPRRQNPETDSQPPKRSFLEGLKEKGPSFLDNKWLKIGGAVVVIIIVLMAVIWFFGASSAGNSKSAIQSDQPNQSVQSVQSTQQAPSTSTPSIWEELKSQTPVDKSPSTKGYLDANGWAAIVFTLFMVLWNVLDWRARIKTHQGVGRFMVESLLLGFLLVPLVNLTATWSLIWGTLVFGLMLFLVNAPIHSATAHKDKTHISSVFIIVAFCLYIAGHFDLPVFFGRLVGTTLSPWTGVYGIGALFILASTLHLGNTILTWIIAILVFLAIWTGASEAGKRLGAGAYVLGVVMILLWILWYWLVGLGENWLVGQVSFSLTAMAALDITRRILSWLLSTVCAFILGLTLGDQSLVVQERQIAFGLQGEKRSISSVVDFVAYATIIAIAWMIMS